MRGGGPAGTPLCSASNRTGCRFPVNRHIVPSSDWFVFICNKRSQQHFRRENRVLSSQSSPSFITRNEVLMAPSARLEGSGIKCAPEEVGVPAYIMYRC